jgi:hypothetical protein
MEIPGRNFRQGTPRVGTDAAPLVHDTRTATVDAKSHEFAYPGLAPD